MTQQTTNHILMVRPTSFGYNQQTAVNNAFQEKPGSKSATSITKKAIEEFNGLVHLLRAAGVNVIVVEDTLEPAKPDAVFPNNWISTHGNGVVITYPMFAPSRRTERRDSIIEQLKNGFIIKDHLRLEQHEKENKYLEGTGSIILDRANKIAYACVSDRTDEGLFQRFCAYIEYQPMLFHSIDGNGVPVYHTNVMMAMGTKYVVICMDSIKDQTERSKLEASFKATKKEIIDISFEQMNSFAGNMLEVENEHGDTLLVMSEQAYMSLTDSQITCISSHTDVLYAPIYNIEKYGGGGVRCMMAEIFLEEKEISKVHRQAPHRSRQQKKTIIQKYIPEEGWVRVQ